jgi:hypothetical protein
VPSNPEIKHKFFRHEPEETTVEAQVAWLTSEIIRLDALLRNSLSLIGLNAMNIGQNIEICLENTRAQSKRNTEVALGRDTKNKVNKDAK